jgi:CBS domain containing-hemolysin-like protein
MVLLIGSVSVVLFISALCSLLEAVLYSVPVSHIESLSQSGKPSGQVLKKLRDSNYVDRPISAILSLNTIANTGGATLAGVAFVNVYGDGIQEVYFTIFITLTVLIFSEVIPKTVGVVFARPLSTWIALPLQWLTWGLAPLVYMCRGATRMLSRGKVDEGVSGEELTSMARLGRRSGTIDLNESRVIENILLLKAKKAREVMTPRTVVFSLSDKLTVAEANDQAGVWPHSRVPVFADDHEDIVGIVHRRDALQAIAENRGDTKLSDIMRPMHFVIETAALDRILQMFLERRQHLFAVIDEYGGLSGVLTLEDILEEILGREIVDEFDEVTDMRELARRRRQELMRERRQPPDDA